jgi:osmotically-inducible protein OsmY
MRRLVIILSLLASLQGCIFVAGAAAGAAAIAVVYDHRKIEKILSDQAITKQISEKIIATHRLSENTHIEITCFNQVVLITGEVLSIAQKQEIDALAKNTPDVKKAYNELTIKGSTSSLTRASDSWITTKIKTEMLANADLKSGTIKVVTENGTVYLMGVVNKDQAEISVDIARQVSGVQKVVKIFQFK